ncbi:hypothetical protein BN971_02007 [Mycobacterium bohemicum DSM 44277]|uniref:Uncharacterized protein n=1 Tax=Mycobacterium bohemicum DSM 44277 TaxID=1236609 RepID=A0A0U0W623_MYCBE|nr:hypothetical protein BN971_02007 [Mycobacterium bohemicum DSM 44277]
MQAGAFAGQQRHRQLEHRPVELLVRLGVADGGELPFDLRVLAQVEHADAELAALVRRGDPLRAVGQELDAQHGVPTRQRRGRRPQAVGID